MAETRVIQATLTAMVKDMKRPGWGAEQNYVTACLHIRRKHFFRTDSTWCCKWYHGWNLFSYCYITLYEGFASLYFHQYCIPVSALSCVCRCCMLSIFYIFANLLGKIVYICISSLTIQYFFSVYCGWVGLKELCTSAFVSCMLTYCVHLLGCYSFSKLLNSMDSACDLYFFVICICFSIFV